MSRDFKVTLAILIPLVVGVGVYIPFSPGGRQRVNMAIATEEIPRVKAILDADKRFRHVRAGVYTGQDGAVSLTGRVQKDDDLFRLMKAVAAERLPVAVSWQVEVESDTPLLDDPPK